MPVAKYIACLFVAVGLLGAPALAADELKVGYVDLQKALSLSKAGKSAKKEYESEVSEAQKELDKMKETFQKRRQSFEKQRGTLNELALGQKKEELIQLEKDLKRNFQDSEAKLRRRNSQIIGELLVKIKKVVDRVGKDKGFTIILEKSSDAVIYADASIDLTDQVVEAFNKQEN